MAWLAVDQDGKECIYNTKPRRFFHKIEGGDQWISSEDLIIEDDDANFIFLPAGSVEKLLGRKLSWNDEPVEI